MSVFYDVGFKVIPRQKAPLPELQFQRRQRRNVYTLIFRDTKGIVKMKATGIVRRVDQLGRIVLPIKLRRTIGIKESDPLEIFTYSVGHLAPQV